MRITSIRAVNVAPVARFEVDELSDVVVVAGPNGVGKTRLVRQLVSRLQHFGASPDVRIRVAATCDEERTEWGKTELSTEVGSDLTLLQKTLQRNRRRTNWKSSILNFESDRTIQPFQNLTFSFDMANPYEEEIGWNSTYGNMRDRFQDTVHSMFRMIEHQKQSIANRAIQLRQAGHGAMNLDFADPMDPFKEVFRQLLGPKELVQPSPRTQALQFRANGKEYGFDALSSGEREVVNIAFDFLLRKPSDCIVVFDEPELHLHPELSYRLIRTLQSIGGHNQLFLCTHSPDVITASLDNSVIFLSPAKVDAATGQPVNQAVVVSEADQTHEALKLLGQSIGIVSLGKRIVLVEGTTSSLDKQVYGTIIKDSCPGLVIVPSGGKHEIASFSAAYEHVLSRSLWGVEFFMLCDGDSGPLATVLNPAVTPRLRQLPRYHIENYFLDEHVWAAVFADMEDSGSPLRDPAHIRTLLRDLARDLVSYAVSLKVSAALRLQVGNVDLMPKGAHRLTTEETQGRIAARATEESARVARTLAEQDVRALAARHYDELTAALDVDADSWKALIPAKPLLGQFSARVQLPIGRAKTLFLRKCAGRSPHPLQEVIDIFRGFNGT